MDILSYIVQEIEFVGEERDEKQSYGITGEVIILNREINFLKSLLYYIDNSIEPDRKFTNTGKAIVVKDPE